jgi:hypothetical protein
MATTMLPTPSLQYLLSHRDPCSPNAKSTKKSPTTLYIEQLATSLNGHISAHDFTHPELLHHLDENYTAHLEYLPGSSQHPRGRADFLEGFRRYVDAYPDYSMQIESIVAEVNEKNGTATVWLLLNITGHPKGLRRQSVTVQAYRRKGGVWRAVRQNGIRGVDEVCSG